MKKADEMEMHINFKAMRLSWVVISAFLLVWNIVEMIIDGEIPFIPFILLLLQSIVFFTSKLVYTKKLAGTNNDEE